MSMGSFEISFRKKEIEEEEQEERSSNVVIGIVMTMLALCGGASILPLVDEYKGVNIVIRTLWRCQLLVIYSLPLAAYFIYKNRNSLDTKKIFTKETCLEFLAHACLWSYTTTMFVWSSDFTLVSHTGLLGNLSGV